MLYNTFQVCRFCKQDDSFQKMVKYSTRHYAHFDCYLSAGKSLDALSPWQVGQFPFLVLKDHDLMQKAEELYAKHKAA